MTDTKNLLETLTDSTLLTIALACNVAYIDKVSLMDLALACAKELERRDKSVDATEQKYKPKQDKQVKGGNITNLGWGIL